MKEMQGVEQTLFIPLVGRIYSSKNFKEFFYDEKALELEEYISNDLIKENTGEYFTIASIARFYEFDKIVKQFIKKHGNCNILCLGCGFETMRFRINDERAIFYEVDFPDVIKQRKQVLGQAKSEVLIGSSILEYDWMNEIDKSLPTLAIVSGVFQYLHKEDVLNLIKEMQNRFEHIEMAFDATNKTGIKKAEKYVKKTGNKDAMMYFYVNNIEDFIKESRTTLIKIIPFYGNSKVILKDKLKLSTKILCYFGDKLGFTKIIYLKLN